MIPSSLFQFLFTASLCSLNSQKAQRFWVFLSAVRDIFLNVCVAFRQHFSFAVRSSSHFFFITSITYSAAAHRIESPTPPSTILLWCFAFCCVLVAPHHLPNYSLRLLLAFSSWNSSPSSPTADSTHLFAHSAIVILLHFEFAFFEPSSFSSVFWGCLPHKCSLLFHCIVDCVDVISTWFHLSCLIVLRSRWTERLLLMRNKPARMKEHNERINTCFTHLLNAKILSSFYSVKWESKNGLGCCNRWAAFAKQMWV